MIKGFSKLAVVLHPESRGRVRLASGDPLAAPRILQNFLAAEHDWRTVRAGLRLVRAVARESPLAPYVAHALAPGAGKESDADLDAHIRAIAITVHQPPGTCKMGLGTDDTAVVDSQLRVFGVAGLRVVDASVMPDLVGGNINAAVTMIAERASDLIRGRPPLAPETSARRGDLSLSRALRVENTESAHRYYNQKPRWSGFHPRSRR